ncbi:MAG: ABC transporter permease [Solirubrobacteraceae bacterium]
MRRSNASLLAMWTVARLKLVRRTPRQAFFTFIFPLMFLVIFNALNSGTRLNTDAGRLSYAQYFTPAIGIFGLATSCYTGMIFAIAAAHERGVMKRVAATPLAPWIFLTAVLLATIVAGVLSVLLMFLVGVPAFGVHIYPRLLPAAIATLVIGGAAVGALGLAVATAVDKVESAPAIANLTLLPLTFISGVFYPLHGAPQLLKDIAHFFPLSHIVDAFTACFSPRTTGSGFAFGHLGVCAAWGAAGLWIAVRRFRAQALG